MDGKLRAKIINGESTIPLLERNLNSLDNTFQVRLLHMPCGSWQYIILAVNNVLFSFTQQNNNISTMSCSDKIARWNVLGIQGSLLSTITEPIYFSTITLGGLCLKSTAVRYDTIFEFTLIFLSKQLLLPLYAELFTGDLNRH